MAKARILIVEDEAIIASVIAGALRKFDFEVVDILNTGTAAVAVALETTPDLVLMDIRLQDDMDGITAAERIQERADIPIIYLTAYADDPTLERAKRTQPYGYIPKPFQEIELRTTIEMALYKHGFEVRLKASEARFRSLFENSQDMIYITNGSGKLQEINPAGTALLGYRREELIGREPDFLYADPADRRVFLEEIRSKKALKDQELRLRSRDGAGILGLVTANLIDGNNSEFKGIQGIIRDVTEKRKREETLLLLQTAIDATSEAVLITDHEGNIVYGNPAVEAMTGYSPPEIIGKNVRQLGGEAQKDGNDPLLWQAILSGRSWSGEFVNRRKDGTLYHQRTIISPVLDKTGAISYFVSIASDVTHEKKLEEQMLQAAKVDSLGRLASGIAHDFNNYLTIINGYSEMLLAENPEGQIGENLRLILQAGKNASKLVAKILGFSRRKASAPVVFAINAALGDLERMVHRLVGENIELRIDLDPEAGSVCIDPSQLEQALINLVINARDAMPAGGKLVLASAPVQLSEEGAAEHPGLHPGSFVAIRVQDNGSGMEPRVLAHMFEPFFTTKAVGEGTGLGLSSVFAIVRQNGGHVWAESVPGQGSTFHLLLPRAGVAPRLEREERPRQRRFDGRTVLLVEDEQGIRQLLRSILEKLGMEVHEAADGEKGLQIAAALPRLDLLLSDVVLPGISGMETAKRLSAIHPQAAVILSSGQGENYLKRAGLDLEKTHFIAKPSTQREIEETIAKALG